MNKTQEEHLCRDIRRIAQGIERIARAVESLGGEKERIVYCEHCKYWKNDHLCEMMSRFGTISTTPNFFCGYGDRKE